MARERDSVEKRIRSLGGEVVEVAQLAARPGQADDFIERALAALQDIVSFDLAAFLEVHGEHLVTRRALGRLVQPSVLSYRSAVAEHPTLMSILERRQPVLFRVENPAEEAPLLADVVELPEDHSCLVIPVVVGERASGLVTLVSRDPEAYVEESIHIAIVYGQLIGLGVTTARQNEQLARFQDRLREQNRLLTADIAAESDACRAIEEAQSRTMRRLAQMAKQVAITDAPVLITGETGTGKEVLARAIHGWSRRAEESFIQVNCAALPEDLIESELFGHKRGAFSGAVSDRPGRFRVADGGTFMLDEIGDLPLATQANLLRVLQEGTFEAVGSDRTVTVDVRVVAATNVDLERAIDENRFREDLFYRLNVFPMHLPPLRERPEDIPIIARRVLTRIQQRTGRGPWTISDAELHRMQLYDWPGNVRELVNVIERARVFVPLGGRLKMSDALTASRGKSRSSAKDPQSWPSLREHEKAYIERVLEKTGGKIYGENGAAELLEVPPTTLQSKMSRLGVKRPKN